MRLRSALRRTTLSVVWIAASIVAVDAQGEAEDEGEIDPLTVELSGRLSVEGRGFPADGTFAVQRSLAAGFVAAPTLYVENSGGRSVTVTPFFRYDHSDPRRTHFDLQEAYLLLFGDAGDGGWEARLGVGQVFWGVTESQHLVDIVNQVDLVEHPTGEAKLGQPMVQVTWFGDWGTLEVVGMSFHRARTFPGRQGRLRLPLVIDNEQVQHESAAGRWRPEVASRYSQSVGPLDLGVSVFEGTSREPHLRLAGAVDGESTLIQYYAEIRQFGLDVQLTIGPWLLKGEAIQRAGAYNLAGMQQDYFASVSGAEYTLYAVGGSDADLSLMGEWNYDSRGAWATPSRSPNTLENDFFLGTRIAFNDVQSTELTTSVLMDAKRSTRAFGLEFGRRISNQWSLRAEAIALLSVDPADLHYEMRHDSFVDVSLTYSF